MHTQKNTTAHFTLSIHTIQSKLVQPGLDERWFSTKNGLQKKLLQKVGSDSDEPGVVYLKTKLKGQDDAIRCCSTGDAALTSEEERQLQLALALSKEEHEQELQRQKADELKLQMAIEESKRTAHQTVVRIFSIAWLDFTSFQFVVVANRYANYAL